MLTRTAFHIRFYNWEWLKLQSNPYPFMPRQNLPEQARILYTKIRRVPRKDLWKRLSTGLKKELWNTPQTIVLQTVSACNLQCTHCFINDYGSEIPDGITKIMKWEDFERITQRLTPMIQKACYFCFSTFEALLNKHLFRMMDHLLATNPNLEFQLLSNGMLITPELVQQLERYPLADITISLDGCTQQVVEDFKTGVQFSKVVAAIRTLAASSLRNKVEVTFVAHRNNIYELPDYIDFIASLGIQTIVVSHILTFTQKTADLALYNSEYQQEVAAIFTKAIAKARANEITLKLPGLLPEVKGCQAVEAFFVDSNGNVAPCDFLAVRTPFTFQGTTTQNDPTVFGNVLYDDPLDIYRSERYQGFRKAHRLGTNLPEPCRNCIDGMGLMCSNRTVYT